MNLNFTHSGSSRILFEGGFLRSLDVLDLRLLSPLADGGTEITMNDPTKPGFLRVQSPMSIEEMKRKLREAGVDIVEWRRDLT